jgi:hypothetical protein
METFIFFSFDVSRETRLTLADFSAAGEESGGSLSNS